MFFLKHMERTITLHPTYFGPRVKDYLIDRLKQDVEGTNLGNFFVLLILDNPEISEGRVVPSSGYAEYTMNYRAVIWRPFRGEVLDGVVGSVVAHGFLVNIGPMEIFVSRHLIPQEFIFDGNSSPPQFANNDEGLVIESGTKVRLKVMGVRAEVGQMYGIGTIKEATRGTRGWLNQLLNSQHYARLAHIPTQFMQKYRQELRNILRRMTLLLSMGMNPQ